MEEGEPQTTFNLHQAKTHLSRLVDRAHAGEEIIVAKAGVPYAKLVPITPLPKRQRRPGGWPELAAIPASVWSDPLPDEELALWEGERLETNRI